jgi:Flp pilus assembly protein TadG
MVEFAFVAPVLTALVLGMFTGGVAYNRKQDLTHAAREGARYGATIPKNQPYAGGASWAGTVRQTVVDRSAGDLTAAGVCVALVTGAGGGTVVSGGTGTWTTGGGTSGFPVNCYDDDGSDANLRVHVLVQRQSKLEAGFFSRDLDLKAVATSRHE